MSLGIVIQHQSKFCQIFMIICMFFLQTDLADEGVGIAAITL